MITKPIAIRPQLVYAPAGKQGRPHFRGGDDHIIPIEYTAEPSLLDALCELFQRSEITFTVDQIIRLLPDHNPDDIQETINQLRASGILWEPPLPDGHEFLWQYLSRFTADTESLKNKLMHSRVYLWGDGEGRAEIIETLHLHCLPTEVGISAPTCSADIIIALSGFDDENHFEVINEYCLLNNLPWLCVTRSGPASARIGPLFIPGETACYGCLSARMASNRAYHVAYANFRQTPPPGCARAGLWGKSHARFVASIIAMECIRFLLGLEPARLIGTAGFWDMSSWEYSNEPVMKLPGCPACAKAEIS